MSAGTSAAANTAAKAQANTGANTGASVAAEGAANTGEPGPRVLIADDQALVRTGFRLILAARGIEVVGEAGDGAEAVDLARRLRPDVVLMDIRMPVLDGLEAARQVLARDPACKVIMLTTFDLDHYVYAALALGASGFLLKDVTSDHLVAAVRLVGTGDALLAPSITRRLVERFAATSGPPADGTPAGGPRGIGAPAGPPAAPAVHRDLTALTPRELEVLALLGRGRSNAELARELTLSEATVKTHVARIFAKLALRDRAQAVVLAYETGLVTPGDADE
ncbi:response regulator transcription factor [Kitasatospora sp. NBC_01287]|uniref:response regulator transcription factor n=1 Tax=Kitasatospora sp. NBC_01287 TaxID=2903573 RepID=UPI00224D4E22|nr:response regulator transcription factor [Kitasatospora sp. NBC_01287]MCX4747462.1 response regulator transcription factor [Kitasatospora sp. NBC_01287]